MLTEITYRKSQHIVACMFTKGQSGILDHDEILDSSGNCCVFCDFSGFKVCIFGTSVKESRVF